MKFTCQPQRTFNLECVLFDFCNLHCTFCYESVCGKRNNRFDREYLKRFPEVFKEYHIPKIKKDNKKNINISVYGGEVFLDSYPDDLFEDYAEFAIKINKYLKNEIPDAKLNMIWLSNYVFTKWDRVDQLLDYTNTNIATSYDAAGRFHNDEVLNKWINTFIHFKNKTKMAGITLHKDNIKAIINGDRGFNLLMDNPQVEADISYYTPINNTFEKFIPSDSEVFDFYKFALDNRYFSVNVISNFMKTVLDIDSVESYCHCETKESYYHCSPTVLTDKAASNTENLDGGCINIIEALMLNENDKKSFYGDNYSIMKDGTNKYIAGRIKRGCISCEWYPNCAKMCFASLLYKNFKSEFCPIKKAYKYIQDNPGIIEDYLKNKDKCIEVNYDY